MQILSFVVHSVLFASSFIFVTCDDFYEKLADDKIANNIICETCHLMVRDVITYRRNGATKESVVSSLMKLCETFLSSDTDVCYDLIESEIDTILHIIDNKKNLTEYNVCAVYFQPRRCTDPDAKKWSIQIPQRSLIEHRPKLRKYGSATTPLKVLHLTDVHYDPLYAPGSNAVCNLPLCCQKSSGSLFEPENAAGYWGDYHVCDMPWHSITNFTSYLNNTEEKFDFVYFTGDIISHRYWDINKNMNIQTIKKLLQHFDDTFKNIPVYPILGNHESHPMNFFAPIEEKATSVSVQWVFDLAAEEWSRWLPESTKSTIKAGGYYTVLVKPRFRIVALNSNVCYIYNLWIIYKDEDPYDQLRWLVDVLSKAERNGERVHILSHIPPGDSECHQQWSKQYRKIVNRFDETIAAQFNGHSHLDEFRLFRDPDSGKVVNIAFNGGSFTTFIGLNPNYRVYSISPNIYNVLDYDHYTMNLTTSNLNPDKSPQWYKLYSFKEAYGLKDLSYKSLEALIWRMSENSSLIEKYYRYQGRESGPHLAKKCDETCLLRTLCSITATEANDAIDCYFLKKNNIDMTHLSDEKNNNITHLNDDSKGGSAPLTISHLLVVTLIVTVLFFK